MFSCWLLQLLYQFLARIVSKINHGFKNQSPQDEGSMRNLYLVTIKPNLFVRVYSNFVVWLRITDLLFQQDADYIFSGRSSVTRNQ